MSDKNLAQGWIDGGGFGSLPPNSHKKRSKYHSGPQRTYYHGVKTWDPWKKRWWVIQTYP